MRPKRGLTPKAPKSDVERGMFGDYRKAGTGEKV
jgi:hypothetical protein